MGSKALTFVLALLASVPAWSVTPSESRKQDAVREVCQSYATEARFTAAWRALSQRERDELRATEGPYLFGCAVSQGAWGVHQAQNIGVLTPENARAFIANPVNYTRSRACGDAFAEVVHALYPSLAGEFEGQIRQVTAKIDENIAGQYQYAAGMARFMGITLTPTTTDEFFAAERALGAIGQSVEESTRDLQQLRSACLSRLREARPASAHAPSAARWESPRRATDDAFLADLRRELATVSSRQGYAYRSEALDRTQTNPMGDMTGVGN